jgi:PKD repeat protein
MNFYTPVIQIRHIIEKLSTLLVATAILVGCGGSSSPENESPVVPSPPVVNSAPVADFKIDCLGLQCNFENTSSDSDGQITSAEWDFGNGQTGSTTTVQVNYEEFIEFTVTLSVTDNEGKTVGSTKTVLPSKNVVLPSDVSWTSFKTEIDKFSLQYKTLPTTINAGSIWFNSLQISGSNFASSETTLNAPEKPLHGVGYGAFLNVDSNKQLVFYSNWVPGEPAAGSAMALEYEDGIPTTLHVKRIDGATHPWILNNSDGAKQVLFPGVDEGKLAVNQGAVGPSYTFDVDAKEWTDINMPLGSHNSIVFDYGNDGDDDLLAQNWDPGMFDGNPVIIENNEGSLQAVKVNANSSVYGQMGVAPFYYENDKLAIIFTDALVDGQYDIEPETNVIAFYEKNLEVVTRIQQLPTPYFERSIFSDVKQIIPEWEGNVGLSHDISAKAIDIDYDGDQDIIISSMIFSDEQPFSVLQILVNKDGAYVDETDNRLFNWLLSSASAHRLDFIDINGDEHIDILVSDHGQIEFIGSDLISGGLRSGSRVLLNDGTGHFVTVIHQQINDSGDYLPSHIPSIDLEGKLRWTVIDAKGSEDIVVTTRQLDRKLFTGPNGINPALWGEQNFNEFYYLLYNDTARESIEKGDYSSGLEHYLFVGKELGLSSFADKPTSD